jgi:hypothetical protein
VAAGWWFGGVLSGIRSGYEGVFGICRGRAAFRMDPGQFWSDAEAVGDGGRDGVWAVRKAGMKNDGMSEVFSCLFYGLA